MVVVSEVFIFLYLFRHNVVARYDKILGRYHVFPAFVLALPVFPIMQEVFLGRRRSRHRLEYLEGMALMKIDMMG